MLKTILASWSAGALLLLGAACTDPIQSAEDIANSCGKQDCPVGTAFREIREVQGGYDISAGFDPSTYSADGAFQSMGSGSCSYACEVINPCPEKTFPVITQTCFTCGVVNSAGDVAQGACN